LNFYGFTLVKEENMDPIRKSILMGLGLMSASKEKVEEIVDELVKKGQVSKDEKAEYVRDILDKAEKRGDEIRETIDKKVDEAIARIRPKTQEELENLNKKYDQLEVQVRKLQKEIDSLKKSKEK
jgi:polyhydroxyalkanoate synthesis regulator phasin